MRRLQESSQNQHVHFTLQNQENETALPVGKVYTRASQHRQLISAVLQCYAYRKSTNLENQELSGNLVSLEQSGKYQGIFAQIALVRKTKFFFLQETAEGICRDTYVWMTQSMIWNKHLLRNPRALENPRINANHPLLTLVQHDVLRYRSSCFIKLVKNKKEEHKTKVSIYMTCLVMSTVSHNLILSALFFGNLLHTFKVSWK